MVCSILNHNLVILVSLVNFENCPPACQLLGISKPIYIFYENCAFSNDKLRLLILLSEVVENGYCTSPDCAFP